MPEFTRRYFLDELAKFRRLMGQRSFWSTEGRPQQAVKAISYVYANASGLTEADDVTFHGTLGEFAMRQALIEVFGAPDDLTNTVPPATVT